MRLPQDHTRSHMQTYVHVNTIKSSMFGHTQTNTSIPTYIYIREDNVTFSTFIQRAMLNIFNLIINPRKTFIPEIYVVFIPSEQVLYARFEVLHFNHN
jgi:hypothetical protein